MIARPSLAESWEVSEDGLVWTFHMRHGVTFHDGSPLTAEDVKFTLDLIGNPIYTNPYSHILSSIKTIEVLDKHTIEFTLRHPFQSLPRYLYFGILPEQNYEGQDLRSTHLNRQPVGTGPYQLDHWVDNGLVMKANDNYFLGKPRIQTILVKIFENRKAAWAKLISGKIDSTLLIESETINIIEQLSQLKLYNYINPYYYLIVFNNKKNLFREKEVRQALNYAIDKNWLIENIFDGKALAVNGLAYPGSSFEPRENLTYPYDPIKALHLLIQNGWSDMDGDGILDNSGQKFQFTIHLPAEGYYPEKMLFFVQQQLAELGIQTKIKASTLQELLTNHLRQKQFDAVLQDFVAVGDPDINYQFWSSSQINQGFNFYSYRNTKVDNLLEIGRSTLHRNDRIKIYRLFQREIFKDPPGIFLFWRYLNIVLPKSLRGVVIGPGAPFISIHQWYFEPEDGTTL